MSGEAVNCTVKSCLFNLKVAVVHQPIFQFAISGLLLSFHSHKLTSNVQAGRVLGDFVSSIFSCILLYYSYFNVYHPPQFKYSCTLQVYMFW